MAHARLPPASGSTQQVYKSPGGLKVVTYVGDITTIKDADAIVTGEGERFENESFITKALLQISPVEFAQKRHELIEKHKQFHNWNIYTSELMPPSQFRYVFHAVIKNDSKEWTKKMKKMYKKLFKKADKYHVEALVLPLLGSGRANVSVQDTVQAVIESITEINDTKYLRKIYLVTLDKDKADQMATQCRFNFHADNLKRNKVLWKNYFLAVTRVVRGTRQYNTFPRRVAQERIGEGRPMRENHRMKDHPRGDAMQAESEAESHVDDDHLGYYTRGQQFKGYQGETNKTVHTIQTQNHDTLAGRLVAVERRASERDMVYGVLTGNQPDGNMDVGFSGDHLPGYEGHGTITITYYFPSGIQGKEHPNPGQPYKGTTRRAYLPDCSEGREVMKLMKTAFDRKSTFTIGRSTTTGQENVVTWNDIHHKTNMDGGPTRFGYPDPGYLGRVKEELSSRGVTREGKKETLPGETGQTIPTQNREPGRRASES